MADHRVGVILTHERCVREQLEHLLAQRAVAGADVENPNLGFVCKRDEVRHPAKQRGPVVITGVIARDPLVDVGLRLPVVVIVDYLGLSLLVNVAMVVIVLMVVFVPMVVRASVVVFVTMLMVGFVPVIVSVF